MKQSGATTRSELPTSDVEATNERDSAENILSQVFSLLDRPSKEQVKALAAKTGLTEAEVRAYFAKRRASMRHLLQRAQRKAFPAAAAAGGSSTETTTTRSQPGEGDPSQGQPKGEGGEGNSAGTAGPTAPAPVSQQAQQALAALARATAAREAGLAKLSQLVEEGGEGGLRATAGPAQLCALMAATAPPSVRCAVLRALCATRHASLRARLATHPGFLQQLEAWAKEAEQDEQVTVLLLFLQALELLAVPPVSRTAHPGLAMAAQRLAKHWNERLAAAAQRLCQAWQLPAPARRAAHAGAAAAAAPEAPAHVPQQVAQRAGAAGKSAPPAEAVEHAKQGGGGTGAPLRKPSATELPHLTALGRKSLYGGAYTAPVPARAAAARKGEGGSPRGSGVCGTGHQMPKGTGASTSSPHVGTAAQRDGLGGGGGAAAPGARGGAGRAARPARPLSVDDILKAKARERASAALQSLGRGGSGGGGPAANGEPVAKKPRLDTAGNVSSIGGAAGAAGAAAQHEPAGAAVRWSQPAAAAAAAAAAPIAAPQPPATAAAVLPQAATPAQAALVGLGEGGGRPVNRPLHCWDAAAGGRRGLAPGPRRGLHPEAAQAVLQYEQDRQRRAAARRVQLVAEYAAQESASGRLAAMQPSLPQFLPPHPTSLPPLDILPGKGEESAEFAVQHARCNSVAPVTYQDPNTIPASPAEAPQEGAPQGGPPAEIPWVSLDPAEAAMHNERLLRDGVRLPQYVHMI